MLKNHKRRAPWLALGLMALLLLGACGAADTDEAALPGITEPRGAPTAETAETELGPTETAPSVHGQDENAPTEPVAESTKQPVTSTEVPVTSTEVPAASEGAETATGDEYEMVTLLPLDGILSIDNPSFYEVAEADEEYHPLEMVLGVRVDGEARAYPVGLLSRHEIVNDTVAGHPIAVTW